MSRGCTVAESSAPGLREQSCSLFCGQPKTEPGSGPRLGRLREATAHTQICVSLCMGMCVSAVLKLRDAHPPISRNRAELEMLGERWDPAASVAGLCCFSEGMWSNVTANNVLFKIPKWSPGKPSTVGRGSADYVGTGLLAVHMAPLSWNHWRSNQHCSSQSSFDIQIFECGLVLCSAACVAESKRVLSKLRDLKNLSDHTWFQQSFAFIRLPNKSLA